jgi:hypothetical protein
LTDPTNEPLWRALWTGNPPLPTHRKRRIYAHLPSSPRCRICLAPFHGIGGRLLHLRNRPSGKNPNYRAICDGSARPILGRGGWFGLADLAGRPLAEQMGPYRCRRSTSSTGDGPWRCRCIRRPRSGPGRGLFMPGMAGPAYAKRPMYRTGCDRGAVYLPVGAVSTQIAFVGTVETPGAGGIAAAGCRCRRPGWRLQIPRRGPRKR